ncbi:NAD(P)/FAD-dependent oxidoreductase [Planctomycetes bacterium TBK1r]|uniref:Ubiquinone biosynthesis hydroxylase family protein n=1 Tax=Stieleria magnilauensis TaxID=2527963 RepID=A0ABX5XM32_9BACT|nr:ubiquinone biosynthesis hydroxylase family protein [Planctomycetes bacterium TBK1r]
MSLRFDVAIIGSGFSGSILARVLASRGRRVALLDAAKHPRFAIGESSTPIVDLLLRRLGQQYGLADLENLSAYGRWQQTLPEVACGMKRGFSYFDHRHWNLESHVGQRSLIVAASPTDENSDTHWYRSDVDAYLFQKALDAGVEAREGVAVTSLDLSDSSQARLGLASGDRITAGFVVDASGAAAVSARLLGVAPMTDRLNTKTCAAFAHFRGVESYSDVFNSLHGDHRASEPFDADAAAQHHLIDDGWAWMLRMNNGITSVGVVSPLRGNASTHHDTLQRATGVLNNRFSGVATIHQVFCDSVLVAPGSNVATIGRVQRLHDPVVANNCLMTPATAVTIDPLHSTGIAHAMAGVTRLADILLANDSRERIEHYRASILAEAFHIDQLIAMAYRSMHSFPRFTASCMVYFAAAIACEERIGRGEMPDRLWQADDESFLAAVKRSAEVIDSDTDDGQVVDQLRNVIAPWNTAGLFEGAGNRYAYTATK